MGSPDSELYAHQLAVAQLEAAAAAVERLEEAYARLEGRLDRIARSVASIESATSGAPVSVGQLRLVVG